MRTRNSNSILSLGNVRTKQTSSPKHRGLENQDFFELFSEYCSLFPLNSSRRLRSNIIDNSVDVVDLIAEAVRNTSEDIIRDTSPVSSHKVVSSNGTDSDEVVVGTVVAHNADSTHIGENGEELFELVFDTALADLITENSVSFLKDFYFFLSDLADYADTKTRTRERLSPNEFVIVRFLRFGSFR